MAGVRTRARAYALQVLYSIDINNEDEGDDAVADTKASFDVTIEREGELFAKKLVATVREHQDDIDEVLQAASKNWRVERMGTVDRNVLRLAVAELVYDPEIPTKVAINEAIELAKKFGSTESAAFVNGILDRVAAKVRKDA